MLHPGGLGAKAPRPALGINSWCRRRFAADLWGTLTAETEPGHVAVGTGHGSSRPRSRSSTPTPTSWRTPCGPTSAPTASRP